MSDHDIRAHCEVGAQLANANRAALLSWLMLSDQQQRMAIYAGFLGATLAFMTADLGVEAAEVVLNGFDDLFDHARAIQAENRKEQGNADQASEQEPISR